MICNGNIVVKRNHKIENPCKRTWNRKSDLLEAGPSPRGGKEGRPSPPPRSHPPPTCLCLFVSNILKITEKHQIVPQVAKLHNRYDKTLCILGFHNPANNAIFYHHHHHHYHLGRNHHPHYQYQHHRTEKTKAEDCAHQLFSSRWPWSTVASAASMHYWPTAPSTSLYFSVSWMLKYE